MNIQNSLDYGYKKLKKKNLDTFLIDTEILLSYALKQDRTKTLLNTDKELTEKEYKFYKKLIDKRATKEPIAYIINYKSFWKNNFYINNKILIPRPDTELLVEEAIKILKYRKNSNILDIGVGSGCIILSILKDCKKCKGVGIDINKHAILSSRQNAKNLNISKNRLKLIKSDIDKFKSGKYDMIVSNPPYISFVEYKNLDKGILSFEPKKALFGGVDGLSEIKKVIRKASTLLKVKGKFLLEIAHNQQFSVGAILKQNGFYIEKLKKDLSNNFRCFICTKI